MPRKPSTRSQKAGENLPPLEPGNIPDFQPLHVNLRPSIINLPANALPDDPIAIFSQFLTNELLKTMVQHTNEYVELKRPKDRTAESRYWHLVTLGEMRGFIAVQIYIGIYLMADTEEYWNIEGDAVLIHEGIRKAISLKRYKEIQRYFHISKPHTGTEPPWEKVRYFYILDIAYS